MAIQIHIETTGLLRKVGILRRILQGRRILGIVADAQLKWIDQNFEQNGALSAPPWAPNRPNTVASKGHSRILQRTGGLRRSFRSKISVFRGGGRVQVGTGHRLAQFAEHGTRAHIILPRRAKVLRFVTVQGTVFARRVRHPGTPARRMLPRREVAERISVSAINAFIRPDLRPLGK